MNRSELKVLVSVMPHAEGLGLPEYATSQSAGMDLCAAVEADITLLPGARTLVPTGLAIALPEGWEAQIRPRSGLAIKNGITLLNSPGTIDADYRGEIKVILANMGAEPFTISRGMRIAQMVVARYERVKWDKTDSLPDSERGKGGFGSTGVASSVACAALLLSLAACEPTVATRGQIADPERLAAISVGSSTREEVIAKIGSPTQVSTFDENVWYYFGRNTKQYAFMLPKVSEQMAVEVRFDENGVVSSLKELDKAESREIDPVDRRTPTYGHDTTIAEQLLGNLGRVGDPTKR